MNSTNRLFVQQALLHDLRRSRSSVSFVTPIGGNNNNNNLLLTRIRRKRRSCENVRPITTTTTTPIITTTFQRRTKTTLAVALSGGVDSSVAAALVQQQIDPTITQLQAVHMTNWNFQDESGSSSSSNGSSSSSNKDENMVLEKVCYEQDWNDAMKVAEHLQVPLIRQRLESEYWNHVFEPYLDELLHNGKMGNPDINCNVYIKFGALREKVQERYGSQTWLVTGHYARLWYPHGTTMTCSNNKNSPLPLEDYKDLVESNLSLPQDEWLWNLMMTTTTTTTTKQQQQPGRYSSKQPWLLAAADISKDQSYFLAGCSNVQLQQVLFPLGDLYKTTHDDNNNNDDHRDKNKNNNNTQNTTEKTQSSSSSPPPPSSSSSSTTRTSTRTTTRQTVRQVAAQLQLPTANKRESMGICFIGKRKSWIEFIKEYTPKELLQPTIQFVDIDSGRIVGQTNEPSHIAFYTIGRGAKLSGVDQKYYVVHHRPSSINNTNNKNKNIVWVCAGTHHQHFMPNH